jgi:hypothetical protein
MAIDLTGGMPAEHEYFFAEKPGPEVRDAANIWLEEENGDFAMRVGIEAVAESWDSHMIWLDVAFADGRVLHWRPYCKPHDPSGPDGKPTVLGAGPIRFECIAPFKKWNVRMEPTAVPDLTAQRLIEEDLSDPPTATLSFDIDYMPAVPPMISGTLTAASRAMMSGEQGSFISPRFEQLCRAEGWLEVDGKRRQFKGQVLRIKRQGVRKFEGFWGHCWQSALFPSGKAFGVNTFPPRDDGQPNFNEGFVFDGDGQLRPAKAIESPWLRKFHVSGEPVPLVLETEDGERVAIDGTTFINCRSVGTDGVLPDSFPLVQQAHALYRWGDEQAAGMIERSTFRKDMEL